LPHLSQFLSVFHSAWIILTGVFCLVKSTHFSIFSSSAYFLKNQVKQLEFSVQMFFKIEGENSKN